ncbi:PEGA domain-containing protein [Patescibacteria group bacterium]
MAVSSIQTQKSGISQLLIYLLAILGIGLLVYFGGELITSVGFLGGNAAVSVDVTEGKAQVFINDEDMGETPFESEDVKPGSNKVTLRQGSRQYETTIEFLPKTNVGVFRDLGISEVFSSGQNIWFTKDDPETVLRVTSEPAGASVYVDNTEIGKTPFTSNNLSEGDYDVRVEYPGFETQETRIKVQNDFTSNVQVKLYSMPVPSKIKPFEDSDNLYSILSDNDQVAADTGSWVRAIIYWNKTRGVNLEGTGVNKELVFDYFIDYKGNIFDSEGKMVQTEDDFTGLEKRDRGAYLGRISDGEGLTDPAKESYLRLGDIKLEGSKAKILETGTGWLRVRSAPNLTGSEIAKVDVGKLYPLIEEQEGWAKIKVDDETEGWVSRDYVDILE